MKKVFMLLSALFLGSVLIQQLIGGKSKHIRSRADDPTIPPVSKKAF